MWLAFTGKRQGIGKRLVEVEQGRIDLQRAGKARQTVFDRHQLPEFILPPFGFGFRAADHGGESLAE